jgi:hypothetical protein
LVNRINVEVKVKVFRVFVNGLAAVGTLLDKAQKGELLKYRELEFILPSQSNRAPEILPALVKIFTSSGLRVGVVIGFAGAVFSLGDMECLGHGLSLSGMNSLFRLRFWQCGLTDAHIKSLLGQFSKPRSLARVGFDFRANKIKNLGLKYVSGLIDRGIVGDDVSFNFISNPRVGDSGVRALCQSLLRSPLRSGLGLSFSSRNLTSVFLDQMAQLIDSGKINKNGRLMFNCHGFSSNDMRVFIEKIKDTDVMSLKLTLSQAKLSGKSIELISEMIRQRRFSQYAQLNMPLATINDTDVKRLAEVIRFAPSDFTLNVRQCGISDEASYALIHALTEYGCPLGLRLILDSNGVGALSYQELLNGFKNGTLSSGCYFSLMNNYGVLPSDITKYYQQVLSRQWMMGSRVKLPSYHQNIMDFDGHHTEAVLHSIDINAAKERWNKCQFLLRLCFYDEGGFFSSLPGGVMVSICEYVFSDIKYVYPQLNIAKRMWKVLDEADQLRQQKAVCDKKVKSVEQVSGLTL